MKKPLLFRRLLFLIAVSISLYSCMHEEIIASADPASKEYQSKSLWKEDEKYIKNVKTVFEENLNADYFHDKHGEVYWNYAMTFGHFDESFLMVPIVKYGEVTQIMNVKREGDRIFFYKTVKNDDALKFFRNLIFNDHAALPKEVIQPEQINAKSGGGCITREVTWTWTDEVTGEVLYQETYTITECLPVNPVGTSDCLDPSGDCSGGINNPPSGGGGGGGYPYPPAQQNPCEKSKTMLQSPAVQEKINELKEQSKILETDPNYGEKGVNVKADGTTSGTIHGGKHHVNLGSTTGYQGGYHNHTPNGIKMHSPPDILSLLSYAISQPNLNFSNAFFGMVGSEPCSTCTGGYKYYHYIISFSGTSQELEKYLYQTNWDKDALYKDYVDRVRDITKNSLYIDQDKNLNSVGLQKLFFETLKNMKMEGKIKLQKIEDSGLVQNIILDNTGNPLPVPCP